MVDAANKSMKNVTPVVKTSDEVKDVLLMVARVAGGFESLMKKSEPSLSLSQWAMLELVASGEGMRPTQIGRALILSRQAVRQAGNKLEKLGFVEMLPAEEGKKAVRVKITDAGREMLAKISEHYSELTSQLNTERAGLRIANTGRILKQFSSVIEPKIAPARKGPKAARKGAKPDRMKQAA